MFGKNKYEMVLKLLEEEAWKLQVKIDNEDDGVVTKCLDMCYLQYLSELTTKIKRL